MSEVDDFLSAVLPRQLAVEQALVNGDAGPRHEFWSDQEPVTILGAGRNALNRREVAEVADRLAQMFTNGAGELNVLAAGASGDLGYLVGFERTTAAIDGQPQPAWELRVTLIFRRENGQWRAVHRHADPSMPGQSPVEKVRDLLNQ